MRILRFLGLAGLVGLTSASVVVVAKRRHWRNYDADEIRDELHRRFAETQQTRPQAPPGD